MSNINRADTGRLDGALRSEGGPTYVKTQSAVAVAAILEVLAEMDDPPSVRLLARPRGLPAALDGSEAPRARAILEEDIVEVRASRAPVTDTTIVTPEDLTRFRAGAGSDAGATPIQSNDASPFAASVYAAHAREWERADPVTAAESATAGG